VSSPKGIVIPKYSPSVVPNSLLVVDPRQQVQVHLGAISLPLGPLLEALRRGVGGLADRAVDRLRKEGLLPPETPAAPRHWVEEALAKYPPRKGETRKDWAKRATPNRVATAPSWLSRNPDVWAAAQGKVRT
jgi:hypothetical protein